MILRVLQILIILSWVVTTSVLLSRTFRADESRFPRAEPTAVAQQFFGAREQGDLILIQDETIAGRLSVHPRTPRGEGLEGQPFPEGCREVLLHLRMDWTDGEESWWNRFDGQGSIFLDAGFHFHTLRMHLRLPQARLSASLATQLDPFRLEYEVREGNQVLVDSQQPELAGEWLDRARGLGAVMGVDVSVLDGLKGGESLARAGAGLRQELQPRVDCRKGRFRIFEGRYHGYILTLEWADEARLHLYFSEFGELLKIEGIPGVRILGESFVPVRLFREPGFDVP